MLLVRCDRCKKEVPSYHGKPLFIHRKIIFAIKIGDFERKKDLCENCYSELLKWLGDEDGE